MIILFVMFVVFAILALVLIGWVLRTIVDSGAIGFVIGGLAFGVGRLIRTARRVIAPRSGS